MGEPGKGCSFSEERGSISKMSWQEALREQLQQIPEVRLAVVFGSVARGAEDTESDLDIAVELSDASLHVQGRVEAAARHVCGRPVDLVLLDDAPTHLRFEIARDGVLVLESEPHHWTDFKTRAMTSWWDWAPTARRIYGSAVARLGTEVVDGPS